MRIRGCSRRLSSGLFASPLLAQAGAKSVQLPTREEILKRVPAASHRGCTAGHHTLKRISRLDTRLFPLAVTRFHTRRAASQRRKRHKYHPSQIHASQLSDPDAWRNCGGPLPILGGLPGSRCDHRFHPGSRLDCCLRPGGKAVARRGHSPVDGAPSVRDSANTR